MNTEEFKSVFAMPECKVAPGVIRAKYYDSDVKMNLMSTVERKEYFKRRGFVVSDATELYRFSLAKPPKSAYLERFSFEEKMLFKKLLYYNFKETSETMKTYETPSFVCIPRLSASEDLMKYFKAILQHRLSCECSGVIDSYVLDDFFTEFVKIRPDCFDFPDNMSYDEYLEKIDEGIYIREWDMFKEERQIDGGEFDMEKALGIFVDLYMGCNSFRDELEDSHTINAEQGKYFVLFDKPTILTYKNTDGHRLRDVVEDYNRFSVKAEYISETMFKIGNLTIKIV